MKIFIGKDYETEDLNEIELRKELERKEWNGRILASVILVFIFTALFTSAIWSSAYDEQTAQIQKLQACQNDKR